MSERDTDDSRDSGESAEMTLGDAFSLAQRMHRNNQFEGAQTLYERILQMAPDFADAWHFLGLVCYQQHDPDKGMEAVETALRFAPDYADAHANLANMLLQHGELMKSEEHLLRALEASPDLVPPRLTLAALRRAEGKLAESESLVRAVIAQDAKNALAHLSLGHVYAAYGDLESAVEYYNLALAMDPDLGGSWERVGFTLYRMGREAEARTHFQKWLEAEPENPVPRHLLAACGGSTIPGRASEAYIRYTFDEFSSSFDSRLAELEYRAPDLIEVAIAKYAGAADATREILDAGCGTGLLAVRIHGYASHLVGVDLSSGMLAHARRRNLYDALIECELCEFLRRGSRRFDVIASADTLCYFGSLEEFANLAYAALSPLGWLFFTVEEGGETDSEFALQHHGRYAHREDYVESVLRSARFTRVHIERAGLRNELGKPVPGLVIAAGKAGFQQTSSREEG